MKILRTFFLALLTLGIFQTVAIANDNTDIMQLTKLLEQAKSMTGNFSQVTLDVTGTRLQETNGELALKRPGLFRWHTSSPNEQLLISDNNRIWLYDPDLEQLTIQKMDQRMSHTPALLLSGNVSKIQKDFKITSKQAGKLTSFLLLPKDKDTMFNSLSLTFLDNTVNSMILVDNVGQRTSIVFKNIKMNVAVDNKLFKFNPPKGTDIIKE